MDIQFHDVNGENYHQLLSIAIIKFKLVSNLTCFNHQNLFKICFNNI